MRGLRGKYNTRLIWLAALLLALLLVVFVSERKQFLVRQGTRALESALSSGSGMKVVIGKVSGHLTGYLSFRDVQVQEPWLPEKERTVFSADEIDIRYRFLDFLSKKFDSKIELVVKKPTVRWMPHVALKSPDFPFMAWMRQWALSERQHIIVRVEGLKFIYGNQDAILNGADIYYENNHFKFELPVSHLNVNGADISTVVKAEGSFELKAKGSQDLLTGKIRTEGTIINWRPTPGESHFDFTFSNERFQLVSSDFLGGVAVGGNIDFKNDYELDISARAQRYPVTHLGFFFGLPDDPRSPARMDFELDLTGSLWEPRTEARARIYEGYVGRRMFKAMDVHVSGIYPTLHLSDSRILMEDGTTMQFAEKDLEVVDLFRDKTYQSLVSEAQQDNVVWGDWEFSRAIDSNNESEFLMQRVFGENTRMHFRKYNDDPELIDPQTDGVRKQMELGFEYRLKAKDSLKLEFRDDEEFVGVEHKTKF